MSNTHANEVQNDIIVNGSSLQHVNQFIYLGALVTDNGSKSEILSRMAKAQSSLQNSKLFAMINVFLYLQK